MSSCQSRSAVYRKARRHERSGARGGDGPACEAIGSPFARNTIAVSVETIYVTSDDGDGSAYVRRTIAAPSGAIHVGCNRHTRPCIIWVATGRSCGDGRLHGDCRCCCRGSSSLLLARRLRGCPLLGSLCRSFFRCLVGRCLLSGNLGSRCLLSSNFRSRVSRVCYSF